MAAEHIVKLMFIDLERLDDVDSIVYNIVSRVLSSC